MAILHSIRISITFLINHHCSTFPAFGFANPFELRNKFFRPGGYFTESKSFKILRYIRSNINLIRGEVVYQILNDHSPDALTSLILNHSDRSKFIYIIMRTNTSKTSNLFTIHCSYKLMIIQVLIIETEFLNTFFDKWHIIRRCGSNVYHVISHQVQYAASTQSKTDFSLLYVS